MTTRGHGVLRDGAGEEIPFRYDEGPCHYSDRLPGTRVQIVIDVVTSENLTIHGSGVFSFCLGRLNPDFAGAQEAIVHGDVHRIYPMSTPKRWQVVGTITNVCPAEEALEDVLKKTSPKNRPEGYEQ